MIAGLWLAATFPLLWDLSPNIVGRPSSLHYYYLAFIVLTYLAYLIVVNTNYRSSFGNADPGIQALIALDWLFGESEESSLSPSIHQYDQFSFDRITADLIIQFSLTDILTCTKWA
jgi:hypothetical protein